MMFLRIVNFGIASVLVSLNFETIGKGCNIVQTEISSQSYKMRRVLT